MNPDIVPVMTREEILAGISRLRPWFHCVDLGGGIWTKTESTATEPVDHPRQSWEVIQHCLPADLTGKTVLDVGCNAGFYSIQAKRRNAARVLGVDAQRLSIRQASFVRRVLGLDIDFRRMSVYDLSEAAVGRFDVTLALGLIYHLKHLVLALERLFDVTNELLIIETAVLLTEEFAGLPAVFVDTYRHVKLHPMAYIENTVDAKEQVFNWFMPSPMAVVALLKQVGFDDVTLFSITSDRAVLLCHKGRRESMSYQMRALRADLTIEEGPRECPRDGEILFRIRVENTGQCHWRASGQSDSCKGAIRLGTHLLKDGLDIAWEYGRRALIRDMSPGMSDVLDLLLVAPRAPGKYAIEFDLVAEHLGWFEDLDSVPLVHEILVRHDVPEIPWYRSEGALMELDRRGLEPRVPKGDTSEFYFGLLAATALALEEMRTSEERVLAAFEWIQGRVPEKEVLEHWILTVDTGADGVRPLIRHLFVEPTRNKLPPPPPPERVAALCQRFGLRAGGEAAAGESFPGEAVLGRSLLREATGLDDFDFVRLAYDRVLGREADPAGAKLHADKLASHELNPPYLLRALFWSDELRT